MDIEKLQKEILDLKDDLTKLNNEKNTLQKDYDDIKLKYDDSIQRNENLIEHNNKLFLRVSTQQKETIEEQTEIKDTKEVDKDTLLDDLLKKF